MSLPRSLTSRPLDLVYTLFFAFHIPISLLLDFNAIYPPKFTPAALTSLQMWYLEFTQDPLMVGIASGKGATELMWFHSFIYMELLFQLPTFVLGIRGLTKNSPKIYPLLCLYGASTATTTLPCLLHVTQAFHANAITTAQFSILISGYVPFLVIPLTMAIDMAFRLYGIVSAAEALQGSGTAGEKKMKQT
ncbi:hypothetical protein E1B28_007615 [Marasmius oreades]|uniref:Efficient mitochondria targeting-associated protein 19 n=1 Tax=Marasmius oreades TaxID=181124 RepID=A0A9P7S2N8_9AGAR|nr:uncharacterized protein E1B28_007615 [Marasmius oreades]KAG7093985.1 hypothetical protein E1B28_007615 [Marasmius oreades]